MSESWLTMIVGAVIGIVLSYILWLATKARARLYSRVGDSLLVDTEGRPAAEKLQINFDGHPVPRVTSTSYGLWNGGNTTIDGKAISSVDPLRLVLEEGEILQVTMEEQTRNGNNASIAVLDAKFADLRFEYLEKGDGFRVNVIHTGKPGKLRQMGEIMGLPQGVQPYNPEKGLFGMVGMARALASVTLLSVGMSVFQLGYDSYVAHAYSTLITLISVVVGLVFIGTVAIIFSIRSDNRPASTRVRGIPAVITNERSLMQRWPDRLS